MTDAAIARDFSIGRVVSGTFRALGANFVSFALLSTIIVGAPLALINYLSIVGPYQLFDGIFPQTQAGLISFFIAAFSLYYILNLFLLACLSMATSQYFARERVRLRVALAAGLRSIGPLILITILYTLALAGGLMLLIIPALIFLTMWAVVFPVAVIERVGITWAFQRSQDLTRGYRWPIFGLLFLYGLISGVLSMATVAPSMIVYGSTSPVASAYLETALTSVLQIAQTMVSAAGGVALLYELRFVKEGGRTDSVAEVFA